MSRGTNPLSVIVAVVAVIAALILAFVVKGILPASISRFSGLIFWGIVIAGGGFGTFIAGKKMNNRRR